MKARRRREFKRTGQLSVLGVIRVRDNPHDERLLKKLIENGTRLIRTDGTRALESMSLRLRLADSKGDKPLVAVNNNRPIYAESLKPGYEKEKVKRAEKAKVT